MALNTCVEYIGFLQLTCWDKYTEKSAISIIEPLANLVDTNYKVCMTICKYDSHTRSYFYN